MPFLKKIVVVEDDDAVAHLVGASLGDAGFLCIRARDGIEALRLVKQESPDLIILDVLMPKLDGLEVVRRLKADPVEARIPVLMLTALASVDDRVRGLDAGADDYLAKPFNVRELLARCQALVRHNRRERDRSPVTDLPGPATLEDTIAARIQARSPMALVFVELAGFERAVEALGWGEGARILAAVGRALREVVCGDDVLAHLGGDDFVVVTGPAAAAGLSAALVERATETLATAAAGVAATPRAVVVDASTATTPEQVASLLHRRSPIPPPR
jgi:DNA-binding response OmpR family regulator